MKKKNQVTQGRPENPEGQLISITFLAPQHTKDALRELAVDAGITMSAYIKNICIAEVAKYYD